MWEGIVWEFGDGQVHTAIFKMDKQQGPTVEHRELCSKLCGSLDWRGVWGRMDTCICMAESLYCLSETITILLISYTPIKIKSFKKERYSLLAIVSKFAHLCPA